MKETKSILLSIFSGILIFLSFPKPGLYYLVWIALIPLISVITDKNRNQAVLYGFLTGIVANIGLFYWIYPTVKFNTGSVLQSIICLLALCIYLSIYYGLWAFFLKTVDHSISVFRFSVFAASSWVMLEFVRTYFLTGFSVNILGYSQYKMLKLIQMCEYTGVYGISFVIISVNIALFQLLKTKRIFPFLSIALGMFLVLVFGVMRINSNYYSAPPYISVAVLQPNIDQYKKWNSEYENEIISTFNNLISKASLSKPDVIIWPETAVPGYLPSNAYMYAWVSELARQTQTYHLVGTPYYNGGVNYYNSILLFNSNGEVAGWHKKTHLIPFGEFIPYRSILSKYFRVLDNLGDFAKDKDVTPLSIKSVMWGTTICSENFFGSIARDFTKKGAQILTNHTNDAWFFDTSAPYQHFIMNVFRAVENRRSVIVCGNTGVSAIIESSGYISKQIPIFKSTFFIARVAPKNRLTFYTKHGDMFSYLCIIVFIVILTGSFSMKISKLFKKTPDFGGV